MTQEEKSILLKDLSARLPYEVILLSPNGKVTYQTDGNTAAELLVEEGWKPYLRSMSSMTEKEKKELIKEFWGSHTIKDRFEEVCWYLSRHFDINGLIEKGLAIPITEENNPYKE